MTQNNNGFYEAFKSKDQRFDGRFFVGVSSTGIYCRPVCKAKLPKEENCAFYDTSAEAEANGYRPCLICRPELAPGTSTTDAIQSLSYRASKMLEETCSSGQSVEEIAHYLECSDRHLRRVFASQYHVSPVQYLQTCRLLLAKTLLTDTKLSILDVAMASGFGSLRRFNDVFKEHYKLTPTGFRKNAKTKELQPEDITVALGYRPPYNWDEMLTFLSARAIPGVEVIKNQTYYRTASFISDDKRINGTIAVSNDSKRNVLKVTVDVSLLPVLPQVLSRVRHLFDLSCEPQIIYEKLSVMNKLNPDYCHLGIRLPGSFEPFEMCVRAILGQQITVKAARTLAGRMVETFGTQIETNIDGLTHIFPTPDKIISLEDNIEEHLGLLGIIKTRSNTILALAHAFEDRSIDFYHPASPQEEIEKLIELPGIGMWSAQYIAMRAMGWTDAFPHTDLGVMKALDTRKPKEILEAAEMWRPWRGYATINLWNYETRKETKK